MKPNETKNESKEDRERIIAKLGFGPDKEQDACCI